MDNLVALAGATLLLVILPGPNVALIVANSLQYGRRSGLVTVFGTTLGLALQVLLVVAGLAALMEVVASALTWVRWLGVIYLVYLGIRVWNESPAESTQGDPESPLITFSQGFMLAVLNPKTLIFNAAFLPQFIAQGASTPGEIMMVGAVYLGVVAAGDSGWALFASAARSWTSRIGHWRNRLIGSVLVGAGIGLALARK